MLVQNVVFPDGVCDHREMYFRTDGCIVEKTDHGGKEKFAGGQYVELDPGNVLSVDTYMNVLDIGYWKKYTQLENVVLDIQAEGHFKIRFSILLDGKERVLDEQEYGGSTGNIFPRQKDADGKSMNGAVSGMCEISYELPHHLRDGLFFFRIEASGKARFYSAAYRTRACPGGEIRLAVNICTFHRNEQLERNLRKFMDSLFFDRDSELCGRLKIYVADNGDDFYFPCHDGEIEICKNSNRGGGSGGFARGLEEIRKHYGDFPCTHTVFMDDDVEFQMESFYRLYAYCALVKPEYADRSLAGRMFRLDRRNIQYTAVEKWNMGNIIHVGGDRDMCRRENVTEEKDQMGEYGGWWMCVFPAEISLKNEPFPFFIHCDDVEYGLRQKKEALTLRGFQVWHETYEYRMNSKILYYDMRNTFVVNAMQGEYQDAKQVLALWKKTMDEYHNAGKQTEKYLCALAMWHFGRGRIFGRKRGQIPDSQIWLCRQEKLLEKITPIFHRVAEKYVRHHFGKIVEGYRKSREERIWQ